MALLSNLSLKYRLHLSNALFLIILIVVIALYFSSGATLEKLVGDQQAIDQTAARIRTAALKTKDYLASEISYKEIDQEFKTLASDLKDNALSGGITGLQKGIADLNALRTENAIFAAEIDTLASQSIKTSNDYIEMMVKKLADEKTRAEVGTMERLVIMGANINTSSNFEIKVRFLRLRESLDNKDSLLNYLDALTANTDKDIKSLANTPFAEIPVAAQKINKRVKMITISYIENVEKQYAIQREVFNSINALNALLDKRSVDSNSSFLSSVKTVFRGMVIVVFIAGLIGIILTTFLASSISKALKRSIQSLASTSGRVNLASGQVNEASRQLAEGTSAQAAGIEETSSSLEEMASQTRANSDNAAQADSIMNETRQVVDAAGESMSELASSMERISSSGQEIGKIIKTIDEIAFQTNLLALNAAVEAARAGEAGAGFAVVADEVRALAMRAAEAAQNTQELIEGTVTQIGQGTSLVDKTSAAFERQVELATKVAALISEVATASGEQARGVDQINGAVNQMDQVVQRNAASAEESAAASQDLYAQAESLMEVVRELNELVGGKKAAAAVRLRSAPAPRGPRKALPKPGPKGPRKVVSPQEAIPFDDDDDLDGF